MKRIFTTVLCLAAFVTTACAKEEIEESIEQTLDFQSGQLLKVSGINGGITIKTGRNDQIVMTVIKKAKANKVTGTMLIKKSFTKCPQETATNAEFSFKNLLITYTPI